MISIFQLIRVRHWVKNLFVFIPAFFAGVMFDVGNIEHLVVGFFSFSFVASAIYILNDYRDISADQNHPEKKHRPLAAGTVKVPTALLFATIFVVCAMVISYLINFNFSCVLALYLVINIAYSFGLKNISILDIMLVATGFLLRTVGGGFIIDVPISKWLLIMVYLLALFMAFAKRLDDFLVNEKDGVVSRKNIKHYNLNFIHSGITMIAGIITVSYLMYTISDDVMKRMNNEHLYFTSVFVIAGILRYLQITLVENKSGSPTKILLTDNFILFTLAGWIASFFIIIYLNQ